MDSINNGEKTTEKLVNKLKNPPSKYKESYDILIDAYTIYKGYISQAKSPEGSLQDYSDNTSELLQNLLKK
jgi:hypothetical protein